MDISPQQAQEIQEIEKQIGTSETGPKILSQKEKKDKSTLINLLAGIGIAVGSTAAVIVLLAIPVKKKVVPSPTITTSTIQIASSPNIVVTTEYVNPFSTSAQYSNPFTASQNPFANLNQ